MSSSKDDSNLIALDAAKAKLAADRKEAAEARAAEKEAATKPKDSFLTIISQFTPYDTANQFVELRSRKLLCYAGDFYEWRTSHYAQLSSDNMRAELYTFMSKCGKEVKIKGETFYEPFDVAKYNVDCVIDALRAVVHVSSEMTPPCWLNGDGKTEGVISCTNGLVDIMTGEVMPHKANFFNVSATNFAYDQDCAEPVEWLKFLKTLWPNDQESIDTVQQILGYVLSGDMRQQKMFLFLGPARSGKGTISQILIEMMGGKGHSSIPLGTFSTNQFALQQLLGKTLALVPDARISGHAHTAIERLLAISGQDSLDVNRKHTSALNGVKLGVRFLFLTNVLPQLADPSGAIATRFIVLLFTQSFLGREDLTLLSRLKMELPGILKWSIEGYRKLQQVGRFTQPKSANEKAKQLTNMASPMAAFVEENYILDPLGRVNRDDFYMQFCDWWLANGQEGEPGNKTSVGMKLSNAFPQISKTEQMVKGARTNYYVGLKPIPPAPPAQGKLDLKVQKASRGLKSSWRERAKRAADAAAYAADAAELEF